jgi:hypothetical protein
MNNALLSAHFRFADHPDGKMFLPTDSVKAGHLLVGPRRRRLWRKLKTALAQYSQPKMLADR